MAGPSFIELSAERLNGRELDFDSIIREDKNNRLDHLLFNTVEFTNLDVKSREFGGINITNALLQGQTQVGPLTF